MNNIYMLGICIQLILTTVLINRNKIMSYIFHYLYPQTYTHDSSITMI